MSKTNAVLVTGGAGFIGSHMVLRLLQEGYTVYTLDNMYNADRRVFDRILKLAPESSKRLHVHTVDMRDPSGLACVFAAAEAIGDDIAAVIHFAGHKAVGESMANPMLYYTNNMVGSVNLIEAMVDAGVSKIVFSSSCTVYGQQDELPITEACSLGPQSPYGRTKYMVEEMLRDVAAAHDEWRVTSLRYFNPCGAHESGELGEDPQGAPMNLVPIVSQVALGTRDKVMVFGSDYNTHDGTAVRDYIHISDLIDGHLAALRELDSRPADEPRAKAFNLGTGTPVSVLDVINAMKAATGKEIAYELADRRPGDVEAAYADPAAAATGLGWRAEKTIADMCADSWRWWTSNPAGYATVKDEAAAPTPVDA
ncbi:UDP-glucose 4-epimerase [Thecamonas trahens ATCC 50062]|uniref:UDP-glucose 4-epimerase n=1 Tax=Thecamonas trahens ATCC 50062 TaxID=461836 RepID=A0A0L0D7W6_THETB|nr:UDP-glucose 4-epimerase [Thecamonas trahens ATCC 50062]KNC48477.1 UDP-glucose 4-epimerase [Thecamonas trahens ATCC 50062]|eukprot:XP_013758589.1 UDP-glucose 4-epimerase [Thecamonas trahens ATCC 50062]